MSELLLDRAGRRRSPATMSRTDALTGIIGARRACTVSMISPLSRRPQASRSEQLYRAERADRGAARTGALAFPAAVGESRHPRSRETA